MRTPKEESYRPEMRYAEIVPKNGSHYVIVDGKEWSRHDDVKIAEQV
jgi:hypothetical protein